MMATISCRKPLQRACIKTPGGAGTHTTQTGNQDQPHRQPDKTGPATGKPTKQDTTRPEDTSLHNPPINHSHSKPGAAGAPKGADLKEAATRKAGTTSATAQGAA